MSSVLGWKTLPFGEIAEQISERIDDPKNSELVDYIGLEHIESNVLRIPKYGNADGVVSSKFACMKGDIIFGRRRAYLRKLAISDRAALVSTDAMVIRPKDNVSKEFLILTMQTDIFWAEVISRSAGSLSPRIKWRDLSSIAVLLPPLIVQEEISKLIFSVQDNIEKTEALIKVAEKLKKGLIEELLTKGIGHKKFEKTELGEIPEEQGIRKLSEVLSLLKDGTHILPPKKERGIPILSALNIENGNISFGSKHALISEDDYKKIHRNYQIENGDVLFTIVGTIGRAAIVSTNTKFSIQRSIAIFKPNTHILRSEYLYYITQSEYFLRQIDSGKKMTAQAGIYLKELSKIKIILPSLDEQDEIIRLLSKIDQYQKHLSSELRALSNLKKKLTNSFLSGDLIISLEAKN